MSELTTMRWVLEMARHELITLHGLTASDGTRIYGAAMQNGCDAEGAWRSFLEETWTIDTLKVTTAIDAVLA